LRGIKVGVARRPENLDRAFEIPLPNQKIQRRIVLRREAISGHLEVVARLNKE